ncbi:LysR family transcriptional regulator [Candidatus Symbiopectobacterium sp. NZEC135]|uniref:LysR family transcriptional regulator n=1 Tax=Candidatus Symbiopectobacterium sp. NZEC135 TaxID=2820471 RepID=UPI002226500E|nr:LysR family transcriptional regulator [Candidatus Symbiopectobacterium sp. NZEC135]MCW2477553.1 LysR family transcriptional regulator [Candidatus Symbiopectobacterium sp. NZEC135]
MDQLLAIRAFARVVEAGNFTRAADSLDMPNATMSKLVQDLEAHLGVKLLQRTTRRVTVTPEGRDYYEKTTRLLADLEDIDTGFAIAHSKPRGHLRIDIGSSTASDVLIPALPAFQERFPDIRIDLGVTDRSVDLISDSVDCVIRGGLLVDSSLVARNIGHANMVTCASPSYLKRYGVPAYPEELKNGHRLIAYVSTATGRAIPFRFERDGVTSEIKIEHWMGINESNAHVAAGEAGLGIIQTFSYCTRQALECGLLVEVLKEWRPSKFPFHVVYPQNRHLTHRLRVFIDWLAEEFPKHLNK